MNAAEVVTAGRSRVAGLVDLSRAGGPPGVLTRVAAVGLASLAAAWLYPRVDAGPLCPLRRLTGVPCPVCGSTTAFVELASGHLATAVAANPVTLIAAAGLILAPLGLGRWWWRGSYRFRRAVLISAAAVAWLYQLVRFDFLPH